MPKKDINQLAKFLVDCATGDVAPVTEPVGKVKSGKAGGAIGGPARAKKLTAEQRSKIASEAAKARWGKN